MSGGTDVVQWTGYKLFSRFLESLVLAIVQQHLRISIHSPTDESHAPLISNSVNTHCSARGGWAMSYSKFFLDPKYQIPKLGYIWGILAKKACLYLKCAWKTREMNVTGLGDPRVKWYTDHWYKMAQVSGPIGPRSKWSTSPTAWDTRGSISRGKM